MTEKGWPRAFDDPMRASGAHLTEGDFWARGSSKIIHHALHRGMPSVLTLIQCFDRPPDTVDLDGIEFVALCRDRRKPTQRTERLELNLGEQERDEIQRLLEKIDTALDLLDEDGTGTSKRDD
jgi:hypothetical protein